MRPTLAVHESENEFRIVKLVPPQFVVCGVKLVEKLGFPNIFGTKLCLLGM